ncbi:hypothetical protein BC830DRAFT_1171431 [Chytriomyces sp. MP71]|nr:hypothetical protein BC830DRAFT_1171431 [Chytriomyces sp. MP71]
MLNPLSVSLLVVTVANSGQSVPLALKSKHRTNHLQASSAKHRAAADWSGRNPPWNQDGPIAWYNPCDWQGGDIGSTQISDRECGPACANTVSCSHFSWSQYNGGTCFFKSLDTNGATPIDPWHGPSMCGKVTGGVKCPQYQHWDGGRCVCDVGVTDQMNEWNYCSVMCWHEFSGEGEEAERGECQMDCDNERSMEWDQCNITLTPSKSTGRQACSRKLSDYRAQEKCFALPIDQYTGATMCGKAMADYNWSIGMCQHDHGGEGHELEYPDCLTSCGNDRDQELKGGSGA